MADLPSNIRSVQERMENACQRVGRNASDITLVAVSKTFPADMVFAAHKEGIRHFGENRVEEARVKIPAAHSLLPPITWHMIGTLQHRKVKDAVALFDIVESVDSVELARRMENQLATSGRRLPVLAEINVSGERTKHGFATDSKQQLTEVIGEIVSLQHLELLGLMTIAPVVEQPDEARPFFRTLRNLLFYLKEQFPDLNLHELSMGMTDDFEVAIEEGATIVRIGRAIFGARGST